MTGVPAGLYLVDTSAIARVQHEPVRAELTRLGKAGLLATCVVIDLEVLYSARNPAEYARTAALRAAGFVDLPPTPEIARRAREIQAMLARRSQHRAAGCPDILTAAIAEHYGAIVLHYDSDFDHIAAVSGLQTRWVVPRGSVS
ncbi:PIN domain nuclease [Catellatospora sichuanensis]|uniref:PIN domain nuclease n=1 Tax=Catellatospora sichuanensis TaxID=1969805 RepID=UPI0011828104|nr:PIN domain nuclease [Catellatospora sichuanensis]